MTNPLSSQLRHKVLVWMRQELTDYSHPDLWEGGEVNYTRLAENAAWHFDHDEWLDDETHWVWDVALEAGEEGTRQRRNHS